MTWQSFWRDEDGFVVSTELALVATLLVIGLVVGLTSIRDQVVQELGDLAGMIGHLNQSYSLSAITGHHSSTAGSFGVDLLDSCENSITNDPGNAPAICIALSENASHEG